MNSMYIIVVVDVDVKQKRNKRKKETAQHSSVPSVYMCVCVYQ